MTTSLGFHGRGGFGLGRPLVSFGLGADGRNNDAAFAPVVVLAMALALQAPGAQLSVAGPLCESVLACPAAVAELMTRLSLSVSCHVLSNTALESELVQVAEASAHVEGPSVREAHLTENVVLRATIPTSRMVQARLPPDAEVQAHLASQLATVEVERFGRR